MRGVGRVGRQHHFGVRGQLDLAHPVAEIRDRYAPNFRVVLRRDRHFERGGEGAVAAHDFRAILGELDFVTVRLDAARLNPEPAAVIITVYLPLDSRWLRGIRSCGEWKRRIIGAVSSRMLPSDLTSSARGRATATSRIASAIATSVMP